MRIMTEIKALTDVDTVTDPGREFLVTDFATFIAWILGSRFNELLKVDIIEAFAVTENS